MAKRSGPGPGGVAKVLLDTLSMGEGILDALWIWLDELVPGVVGSPITFKPEDCNEQKLVDVPLTSIWYHMPADGVPLFPAWRNVATGIFWAGFDPLREPMECKIRATTSDHGGLQCTKGLGRLSMIYFGALYTFLNKDDDSMTDAVKEDFVRWIRTVATLQCRVIQEAHESHYEWKRIQASEQQAQRERKNIIQKALVFTRRAKQIMLQEPAAYGDARGFRNAFLRSVEEFNHYGLAVSNPKYQVPDELAVQLFGFKAGVSDKAWQLMERHLHQYRWEQSAFSKEQLLDPRWLLEACAKAPCAMWNSVLTVDPDKQLLFLERILKLHSVTFRRAGARTMVRVSLQEWCNEVDVCCTLGWVISEMRKATFDDGTTMFAPSVLDAVQTRCIEGDFHAEIREVLSQKDPTFKPSFAAMWVDNLPEESAMVQQEDPFSKADENLENLSKDARKAAFERDCLQFARDVATVGQLYEADMRSEKSRRTAKVLHLKNQNLIGASVVKSYMESNACFKAGVPWEDPEATIAAEKYLQDVLAKSGAVLLWGDLTKLGKITGKELDSMAHVVSSVIRQKPTMSAAFLVAPVMAKTNIRTEMRRVEDKMDMKNMTSILCTVRMEVPPTSKRVPLVFHSWLIIDEATQAENIFASSQLVMDRSTRRLIPFAAETSYIVPSAERDSLPHASEGMRSLSDTQESAQFLSGKAFPEAILTALLTKTALPSKLLGIVNCTPYDCWLERVCVESNNFLPGYNIKTLSVGKSATIVDFCEKTLALELVQGWKKGKHPMGNVRAYDPDPVIPPDDVKLQDFSFKLIQVEAVAGQTDGRKFSDKYKVKVPANIRGRYADDVVFGGDWKELLTDFDKKFNIKYSAPASPAPAKPDTPEKPPWVGEPSTMQALLDRYNVEAKITGRLPGTTLFVVSARDRAGKSENIEEHQEFKLFLAAHIPVEIDPEEFILAHGTSRFLRPEKVQDLKRKGKTGELQRLMVCAWANDEEQVIMEVQEGKSTVDTEKSTWRRLLMEFEEEGHTDLNINGHSHDKKGGVDEGEEGWHITPKVAQVLYTWPAPASINGVKYSSVASVFNAAELQSSRMLDIAWRVAFVKESKEFTPRKPLYFLKNKTVLCENQIVRLI